MTGDQDAAAELLQLCERAEQHRLFETWIPSLRRLAQELSRIAEAQAVTVGGQNIQVVIEWIRWWWSCDSIQASLLLHLSLILIPTNGCPRMDRSKACLIGELANKNLVEHSEKLSMEKLS